MPYGEPFGGYDEDYGQYYGDQYPDGNGNGDGYAPAPGGRATTGRWVRRRGHIVLLGV